MSGFTLPLAPSGMSYLPAAHSTKKSSIGLENVGNGTIPPVSTGPSTNARATRNVDPRPADLGLEPPRPTASGLYNAFYNATSQSMGPHSPTSWHDATDSGMPSAGRVEGMTTFGTIDSSDPPELNGTLRRQMAEVEASSGVDSLHAQEVDRALSAAKQRIDRDMHEATVHLKREHRQPSCATDLYSGKQIAASRNLTASAVARFCNAAKSRESHLARLERHAANRGAERVRMACVALSLPCAAEPRHKELVEQLEKSIEAYLKADKGDLHALQDTWGGGGFKQCEAIDRSLEQLTIALGREQIGADIMAALAPALLDGLERKGHPVTHESLAAALNPEALGGFLMLTESSEMLLRMADTLPKLLRAAHGSPRAGEPRPDEPISAPAPPASPSPSPATGPSVAQPPSINVAPVITVNPMFVNENRGSEPLPSTATYHVTEPGEHETTPGWPQGRRLATSVDDRLRGSSGSRRTSTSSTESEAHLVSELNDALEIEELDDGDSTRAGELPRMSVLHENTLPLPPDWSSDEEEDPEPVQGPAKDPVHAASVHTDGGRFQPAGSRPRIVPQSSQPPMHVRSYLHDDNPGLRRAGGMGNSTLFQMNVDALRDNIPAGSRVRADSSVESPDKPKSVFNVRAETSDHPPQVNHHGRGAERDGDVMIVPGAMKSSVPRSP